MKGKDVRVSPYILIPVIFSGLAFLAILVAYRVMIYAQLRGIEPFQALIWIAMGTIIVTFICGYLIVSIILKPITRFVRDTEKLPVMITQLAKSDDKKKDPEDMDHLNRVLEQVTTILGKIEARDLFPEMVGQSKAMRGIFGQIMKVAPTDTTVLILGDSGTGKELVATSIYKNSLRKGKPFVKINCVAIPESLLESELFGYEKGAFTGAVAQKKGKFEIADGGTIFLDEIGDMPPATQAKLLRVLQEKEFERVGGTQTIRVDVRFITATNKNLSGMIKSGEFREDLYYRLNVFALNLPPLRERREDIPFLIEHFLQKAGKDLTVSHRAMQLILGYGWPGNVRELQNIIERAAVIAEGSIEPGHLPPELHGALGVVVHNSGMDEGETLDERLAGIEKGIIIEAISRADGVQVRAAQFLGINPRSLWHRVKKHQIDVGSRKKPQNL